MRKDELRERILSLEPTNKVGRDPRASHDELTQEYRAAKRRNAAKQKSESVSADLHYKLEKDVGNELMSWKLYVDGEPATGLSFGEELPMEGTIVPDDGDGPPLMVKDHAEGLDVVTGDLSVREQFDPRRIYKTPNGSLVTFKREEAGRVVLWSFKVGSEIMLGPQVPVSRTNRTAKPVAQQNRRMTQKLLAAYLIACNPAITGSELTESLKQAFPQNAIGPRHGPHYLSLSRNGRLPEPPDSDPREW